MYKKNVKVSQNDINLISAIFGLILGVLIFTFFIPNYFSKKGPVDFIIEKGSSFSMVVDELYIQELIPNTFNMRVASFLYGAETQIKSGKYKIPNGLTYFELLELLMTGTPGEQIKITIPEGIWQYKVAQQLRIQAGLDSSKVMELSSDKQFLKSLGLQVNNLEGYLLPESYYFYNDVTEEEILTKLKYEMDNLFDDDARKQMAKLGMTKNEILTMASLVDGESNLLSEFKKVAGVYYNRLKKRIKLQADPTLQYLIRHRKKYNKIYYNLMEIDSPFNTYMYYGLPPAPINNPGREAVMAALYPEEHDYIFFCADGTGGHAFAKTSREHARNVKKYREWRRKNNR